MVDEAKMLLRLRNRQRNSINQAIYQEINF